MASYAKQMMEVAAKWIEANPDPENPFIHAPRTKYPNLVEAARRFREETEALNLPPDPKLDESMARYESTANEAQRLQGILEEKYREIDRTLNEKPELSGGKATAGGGHEIVMARWLLAWARHGYNVFDLSPDFVAAMLLTDASEIDMDEIRLPFGGLLLTIPSGFAQGVEGLSYTKIHIHELPANKARELSVGNQVKELLNQLSEEDRRKFLDDARAKVASMAIPEGEDGPLVGVRADGTFEIVGVGEEPALSAKEARSIADASSWLFIEADDGVHVLHTDVERKGLTWRMIQELPDNIDNDADRNARRTIQQIVFGTLAFLCAVKDAATPREVQRKPKKHTTDEKKLKHWDVGRDVKISPTLIQYARSGSREVAFRVKHNFMVRGHYRNQAHGVGRAERKRIFIEPFEKGPKEGARLVHTYKPQADEESTS